MEPKKNNVPPGGGKAVTPLANGNAQSQNPAPIPAGNPAAKPKLFGGHKGGKPTLSGFPVDSPEHAEFLRKREAKRKRDIRAEQSAALAPPIPAAPAATGGPAPAPLANGAPAVNPVAPVAGGGTVLPGLPADTGMAPGVVVVPWTVNMLRKPAQLITRIIDRLRKIPLQRRLDTFTEFTPDERDGMKKDLEWNAEAMKDFSEASAEVAALHLNKAGVSSEASPYIALVIAGVELGTSHLAVMDRMEKLYKERMKNQAAPKPQQPQPQTTAPKV